MMTTPTMSTMQPEWSGAESLAIASGQKQEAHRVAAAEARKRRIALRSQAVSKEHFQWLPDGAVS
jgi:hypothetical protein